MGQTPVGRGPHARARASAAWRVEPSRSSGGGPSPRGSGAAVAPGSKGVGLPAPASAWNSVGAAGFVGEGSLLQLKAMVRAAPLMLGPLTLAGGGVGHPGWERGPGQLSTVPTQTPGSHPGWLWGSAQPPTAPGPRPHAACRALSWALRRGALVTSRTCLAPHPAGSHVRTGGVSSRGRREPHVAPVPLPDGELGCSKRTGRDQQGRAFLASNTEKQETQEKKYDYV